MAADESISRRRCVPSRVIQYSFLAIGSLTAAGACYAAAGPTLGIFIGGFFIVTFLTPGAVLEETKARCIAGGIAVVVSPVAVTWLLAVAATPDTLGQWVQMVIVLTAYSLVIGGLAVALRRIGLPPMAAAALAIIAGLGWLSWPVWLVPNLGPGAERIVAALAAVHPPLVANGVLTHEPAWTERSLAYHLTNLNQDIPVQLPSTATRCATAHLLAGAALWLAARKRQ